jgi:hypothetical protein
MAASAVSICSNALLMVGGQTINSFTGDLSDRQRLCANLYETVRDYVLSSHPWNVCIKRVLLNPDATAPVGNDYALQYTLPSDFLRMLSVGDAGIESDYRIENGKILCDDSPLLLRYVYKNTNEASWTPLLVMAVTLAMREVVAYPITQSTSLEQLIDQAIGGTLKNARTIDAQDQPPETLGDFRLLNSRFSPRGGMGQI